MKRVRILRDGPIGDPGNVRASVVYAEKGQIIELSDTAADMAVNESKPPRAEYIDGKSELGSGDEGDDGELGSGDKGGDGSEPGSEDEGKASLLDRLTGKGKPLAF